MNPIIVCPVSPGISVSLSDDGDAVIISEISPDPSGETPSVIVEKDRVKALIFALREITKRGGK